MLLSDFCDLLNYYLASCVIYSKPMVIPFNITSGRHARAVSLGGGKRRKKSIIGSGLEVTKFKHFKSFVESKIMSKSDRALEQQPADESTGLSALKGESGSSGITGGGFTKGRSAEAIHKERRASKASMSEFDPLKVLQCSL